TGGRVTASTARAARSSDTTELRHLHRGDGAALHALVRDGGGLDLNSPYAYVLGERMFAATSVAAATADGLDGFVYGIAPANEPTTLFVWQVGVAPHARGRGLGLTMLRWLVDAVGPTHVEATVTPSNTASRRLFAALARDLATELVVSRWVEPEELGDPGHEPEDLHRIGPIPPR
ncbi:MAG: diaminobutyrate acetyltransferase, partial [Nitriliruptor sp.]